MATPGNTVPAVLHHWATHQPDTAAFVFVNSTMKRRVLTRANVYRLASRFSAILRRDDVKRGDVICNTLPNSPERLVSDMGIMMAGATAMNGQILLKDGEDFLGNLIDSCCTAVILDPLELSGAATVLKPLQMEDGEDGKVRYKTLPALRRQYQCYWTSRCDQVSFMDMLEQEQDSYVDDVTPDDMACIWTTSGSTGFPKLIPRTHGQVITTGTRRYNSSFGFYVYVSETYKERKTADLQFTTDKSPENETDCNVDTSSHGKATDSKVLLDTETKSQSEPIKYAKYVYFNNGKLGWSGGFPGACFIFGVTRVLLDLSAGSPDNLAEMSWTLIAQERCEYAFLLPEHIKQILSQSQLWLKSSWRCLMIFTSGQPVHKNLLKDCCENKMTYYFHITYGSSDLGPLTTKVVLDPELHEDCNSGKPSHDVEVKVVDENMQEVPPGSDKCGEILARTSTTLRYYIGNEEATRKTILADGWCRSGDVGYISDQGEVFVFCRTSFAIMRGAYIVYPGWLENRIRKHPAVRDVMVVPVPDPVLHQELCARVLPSSETELTEEDLKTFCESLFLTSREDHMTAVPRYFLFFSNFPTTTTGKPCRRSTLSEALARLSK